MLDPGVAKLGIALGSGPRGRGFKSRHSDQNPSKSFDFDGFFFIFDWHFALKVAFSLSLFRPFPLLTTAPPQTGKSRASGVCPEVRLLFALMRDASPLPVGPFRRRSPLWSGQSAPPAASRRSPGHGRRCCGAASPRPATPASTALPTGGH